MSTGEPEQRTRGTSHRRMLVAWWITAGVVIAIVFVGEARRWSNPEQRAEAFTFWLCGEPPDWLPFVPLLLLLPVAWFCGSGQRTQEDSTPQTASSGADWLACLAVAAAAFGVSTAVGREFLNDEGRPMPPAYHDEFSYLFQAETFLAGRTSFPSFSPRPELFDQMHVLNEGRFASRYFPGVGLWMMPFVAIGNPWLGQHVAAAIIAGLVFWIGRELRDTVTGLTAGLLTGLSPGLAIFSNLLLSHHPTLVALMLFLWAFLRMQRTQSGVDASLAGFGLTCAMLCRPMTAAGIGLPFGFWFAWKLLSPRNVAESSWTVQRRIVLTLGLAIPLAAGFAGLFFYNQSITGDGLTSPYQVYTDLYTPRHVYGFDNVVRGEQRIGPKVIDHYDRWAENLDARLAVKNVGRRLTSSLRWTLGIVPLALGSLFFLLSGSLTTGWRLIALAIVSLHAVHIPYWFEGIMGWHYVLESAPLWLLLFGGATSLARRWWRQSGRWGMRLWWGSLIVTAGAVNTVSIPLAEGPHGAWTLWRSPLDKAISEVRYPRRLYDQTRQQIDALRNGRPAVVLVLTDPADRSMDDVTNDPALSGPVLFVRVPTNERNPDALERLTRLFPDREPFVLDAATRTLQRRHVESSSP